MFYLIVAMGKNRVIGKNGDMPWGRSMKADLQHLKQLTMGNTVIMGRKTYESIGRPLPHRTNIICTRQKKYHAPGCLVQTVEQLLAKPVISPTFILGGAEIYQLFLPYCTKAYITQIQENFEGDTFFPDLDSQWRLTESHPHLSDPHNPYDYTFELYERIYTSQIK